MDFKSYAFISYQTAQKDIAGKLQRILAGVGIKSFLAHEDIVVSEEWRLKILEEIEKTNMFIALLSAEYFQSSWCVQESGMAAYKKEMTIIPLSIDGSIPQGFISHIQSSKINPEYLDIGDLIPGLIKHDFNKGIDMLTEVIRGSKSYSNAESNFRLILPHLPKMSDAQVVNLLNECSENRQVYEAGYCAKDYLPPLLVSHGHLLDKRTYDFLTMQCNKYK